MNALVFTSLFPNNVWRHHGVFIKERTVRVARLPGMNLRVVAPVPYFPALKLGPRYLYSQVAARESVEGLDVHHPRYAMIPKVGMRWHGWMMYRSVLPYVERVQREFDFDLIDAHYIYPDGFAAVEIGRRLQRPVVVSARGSDIHQFGAIPAIRGLLVRTLTQAQAVIAVSRSLRDGMVALGVPAEKIAVIPNGVDSAKFRPSPREKAREALGLPPGRMILSVGNLTMGKGFDRIVRALPVLASDHSLGDVQLVIVGEGGYRDELSALIASLGLGGRVRLQGDVHHEELRMWYNAADVFCLATRYEGWPNVILEALACGTPVVATPVGGIPDIVTSEELGLLVEGDARDLAGALAESLRRSWDRDSIARYASRHSWEQAAESVKHVFDSVIARA